ncbi:MAG: metallophosphoesterase [Deltaproteobacteria bacterium]|nr:metallophosphoesterase [Deltaproteobacteria bacterium]
MKLGRRQFLQGAALLTAGAAVAPAARAAVDDDPRVQEVEFRLPDLDPAHDGLRVAQLSDLHVGTRTPPERIAAAIALASSLQPDLVVLTGDYLSRGRETVALLPEQLRGLTAPTVAVLGNHDHWVDAAGTTRALSKLGYDVLRNQHTRLRLRGAPLSVVGVDDLLTGHADPERALAGVPRGSRLVLAHGPRTADRLRGAGEPLLVLTGHTHGGQIAIPIVTRLLLSALVREPYLRGHFHLGPVQLYVNRGIGNTAFRLRVNSDPEVTLATLRREEPA